MNSQILSIVLLVAVGWIAFFSLGIIVGRVLKHRPVPPVLIAVFVIAVVVLCAMLLLAFAFGGGHPIAEPQIPA